HLRSDGSVAMPGSQPERSGRNAQCHQHRNAGTSHMVAKGKYARFFALLGRAQREGKVRTKDYHEVVAELTSGQKKGLSELSVDELRHIEHLLQDLVDPVGSAATRMRRKVIAILAAHGMLKEGKPDMDHINAWCVKFGFLHKPLDKYSNKELPRLVSQAEGVM